MINLKKWAFWPFNQTDSDRAPTIVIPPADPVRAPAPGEIGSPEMDRALALDQEKLDALGPVVAERDQLAPWMRIQTALMGVKEFQGRENPIIVRMFELIGKPEFNEDEIPWCAADVGACLFLADQGHSGSALAASYMNWKGADRVPASKARYGDIVVTSRTGGNHVFFFLHWLNAGEFRGRGGNQWNPKTGRSEIVNDATFQLSSVRGFYRPNGRGTPRRRPGDTLEALLSA